MKPVRLHLEAFGPFCSEQEVPFDALAPGRPFTLEGPVGSGKSFLLDAICFVLYGETATPERSLDELRCSFAQPDRQSRVEFDFEQAGERYRVERSWREGELQEHSARLWRASPNPSEDRLLLLADGRTPCREQAVHILGLEAEQFRQVCVIPQGHFGRLLLAPAAERAELLSRLVGLERLKDFESALRDRHRATVQETAMLAQELRTLLQEFDCTDLGLLQTKYEQTAEAVEELELELQELQHRSGEWSRRFESATRYETLARQCELASKELELLESEGADTVETEAAGLQRALALFADWQHTQQEEKSLQRQLEQLAQSPESESFGGTLAAELEQFRKAEEQKFNYRRALERFQSTERELLGLAELEEQAERSRSAWLSLKQLERDQRLALRSLKKRHRLLAERHLRLERLELELKKLEPRLEEAHRRSRRLQQQIQLRELHLQTRARHDRLRQTERDLERELADRRRALQHALQQRERVALLDLSRTLESGRPCPVCGSLEHPSPTSLGPEAQFSQANRQEQLLEQLNEACQELEQKLEHAREERERAGLRCAGLEGKLERFEGEETMLDDDGEGDLERLDGKVRHLRAKLQTKESVFEELTELETQSKPLRRELKRLRLGRERLEALSETATRTLQAEKGRLQERLSEVLESESSPDLAPLERLRTEIDRVSRQLERLETRAAKSEEAARLAQLFSERLLEQRTVSAHLEQVRSRSEALVGQLLEQWSPDYGDWEALHHRLARLQREQRLHREHLVDRELLVSTVRRQLEQSRELLLALPQPEESTAVLGQTIASERESLENRSARRATLEALEARLQEALLRGRALEDELGEATAQAELLEPLLLSVEPADPQGFGPFSRWGLRRFFERVLQATNLHLQALAPDRFYLQCDEELRVSAWDLSAEQPRSPGSLSGGERFLASLALALGLGDALAEEGPTAPRPRTLLLDEGFGSLDTASLEAALAGLEQLSGSGYTVGVVSHLNAVRNRFSQRLKVARRSSSDEAYIELG